VKYGLKPFFSARKQSIQSQLQATGIDQNDPVIKEMKVFPNPATEKITVVFANISSVLLNVRMIDIFGKIRGEFLIGNQNENRLIIPIEYLVPGIYFLYAESSGQVYQAKFIKR
jgi:hypothetical protein